MDKIKGFIVGLIGLIAFFILCELMLPNMDGLTIGILKIIWIPIKEFFLQDWILSAVLFVVGSLCLYGTIHISRRSENKLWAIVTGIVSIISYIGMFVSARN